MHPSELPFTFLVKFKQFLSTDELYNFAVASFEISDQNVLESYLFRTFFGQNKSFVLDKSSKLDVKDAKRLFKTLFKNRENVLEKLSFNFCPNLNNQLLKVLDYKKFSSLASLQAIDVEFNLIDLTSALIHLESLKSIAFSLHSSTSSNTLRSSNISFKSVDEVKLCLGPTTSNLFIDLFANYLNNVTMLQVYYIDKKNPESQFELTYGLLAALKKSKRLQQLLFNDRIMVFIGLESKIKLVNSLEYFNFRTNLDNFEVGGLELHRFLNALDRKIKFIDLSLECVQEQPIYSQASQAAGLQSRHYSNIDSFLEGYSGFFNQKLASIRLISPIRVDSVIENWRLNTIEKCEFVIRIDLKTIHVHSESSLCQTLSSLKHLKYLFLPCCALACAEFKKQSKKVSFKRVFESSEDESETNAKLEPKQLSYLARCKIVKLGIYRPSQSPKKTDLNSFNCENVDHAELLEISKFDFIKSLCLHGIKIIGNASKFEEVFETLSLKSKLTELVLNQSKSFVTYENQQRFSRHLRNFTHLKRLRIEYSEYEISQLFLDNLFELTDLVQLEMWVRSCPEIFFKQTFQKFKKLTKINFLEFKFSQQVFNLGSKAKTVFLKELAKVLPNKAVISIEKWEQSTLDAATRWNNTVNIYNKPMEFETSEFFKHKSLSFSG